MDQKKILLIGAGRSSSALIRYLIDLSPKEGWEVTVADFSKELALEKTKGTLNSRAIAFDINNEKQRMMEIAAADIVISLLPPGLHIIAARDCVRLKKNMVTASYISDEIKALDDDARKNGVLIMNECGLDPGIDHMSAMQIIHDLQQKGATIESFKSYTGGLIAPESNDNPWGYKFTWNPRNVVLAGQGTARYIEDGSYKYIPYNRLYTQTEKIEVPGYGKYEGYANRDSLAYRHHYELDQIPTLLRGTLRNEGFCSAWNIFVSMGITDDSFVMEGSGKMTYAGFIRSFLPSSLDETPLIEALAAFTGEDENGEVIQKIKWTGLLDEEPVGIPDTSPARILQHKLEQKWLLKEGDIDMIIMLHSFKYRIGIKNHHLKSTLVVKGEDPVFTAMAKTVGLPLGMVAKRVLQGDSRLTGVCLPVMREIYEPVLAELAAHGLKFTEHLS